MTNNISDLTKNFQSIDEMRQFAEAQFKQIIQLNKKVKELGEKNNHLEKLLKDGVPLINKTELSLGIATVGLMANEAIIISEIQIHMLKEKGMGEELCMEDAKKLEIYNKIINSEVDKSKGKNNEAKILNDAELLSLVNESEK